MSGSNRPSVNLPKYKPSSNDYNPTGLLIHNQASAGKMADSISFMESKNDLTVQQVVKTQLNVETPTDSLKSYLSSFFGGDDEKKGAYLYTYSELSNLCEPPPSRYENSPNKELYQEIFCTKTYIPNSDAIAALKPNDVVTGKFRNEAELSDFIPLDTLGTISTAIEAESSTSASEAFSNPITTVPPSGSLPTPNSDEYVIGDEFLSLTSIVEQELKLWNGKKENDSSVYDVLKKYWTNVGWKQGSWTPTGTPWSAAYISYIMTRVDPSFPKSANHNAYANEAKKNRNGWTAWTADSSKKYKAQVGDILIYPRPEGGANASHGDAVYKINNNIAYLTGGNLANTALGGTSMLQLQLDSEGFYSNFKSSTATYTILLKKNGRIEQAVSTDENTSLDNLVSETIQQSESGFVDIAQQKATEAYKSAKSFFGLG